MKSKFLIILTLICSLLCSACGGRVIHEYDPNKTQIFVSVFDGGYGTEWIDKAAAEFNEDLKDYEIIISPNKAEERNILSTFISGYPSADIYFTTSLKNIKGMISGGYLIDLSDIYKEKAADEDEKTIEEKMNNAELYKEVFSDSIGNRDGIYGLPFGDSFIAPVYDNDTFVEKEWAYFATEEKDGQALSAAGISYTSGTTGFGTPVLLFSSSEGKTNYEKGDVILTAGKDGKYGTYDDGQPQTMAEYDELIAKIKASGAKPFIWSGTFLDYSIPYADMIFAQYEGVDNFKNFFTYDFDYKGTHISLEDGYKVWEMDGVKLAMEYTYRYLYGNGANYHPAADSETVSHAGAQNNFILGYKNAEGNPLSAMLFDGIWWENEAKTTFNSVTSDGRGFGRRDYRFMLFPEMEGQKGIDGKGNGSVVSATDTGGVFAYKSKDETKNEIIKDFIKLTTSDKYLREFSKSGGIRPYTFDLGEENYQAFTPCQKAAWDIYHDSENIAVVRKNHYRQLSPIGYATSKTDIDYSSYLSNVLYVCPVQGYMARRNIDSAQYIAEMQKYYKDNWPTYVGELKKA